MDRYLNLLNINPEDKKDFVFKELYGEVEWIFSNLDIEYMTEKYKDWESTNWDMSLLNKDVEVYSNDQLPISTKQTIYRISHPLYDKKKKKAFIVQSSYKDRQNTFFNILLFKKVGNEWVKVGSLFLGHY